MKDMPEFYDHAEEEIESEMKYMNKLLKEAKWQQWTPTPAPKEPLAMLEVEE